MTEAQPRRRPLSRERVQAAAVEVADRDGLEAVTMRSVATLLGVEAMALYRHVSGKNDLLDSLVGVVIGEVVDACAVLPPAPDPADWRTRLRTRILTARDTLVKHPWAPALISSHGSIGPDFLRYMDDVVGILHDGGFGLDTIHHAMHALGPRALGYSPELFDLSAPAVEETDQDPNAAVADLASLEDQFPFIAKLSGHLAHEAGPGLGWCDDQSEFEFGLDVMLDGLAARLASDG